MTQVKNYIRGGQIWAHNLRMFMQIFKISTMVAFGGVVSWVLLKMVLSLGLTNLYLYSLFLWARFKQTFSFLFQEKPQSVLISYYNFETHETNTWRARDFIHHPFLKQADLKVRETFSSLMDADSIQEGTWVLLALIIGSYLFFFLKGRKAHLKKFERGNRLLTPSALKKLIPWRKRSDLRLQGLPLIKGKETSHFLITGTTGAGKSNCLNLLIPQIRKRKNSGIIVDLTGDYVSRYYREGQDLLLNPFDQRSLFWDPWAECDTPSDYDQMAEAFIGTNLNTHDPFWQESAKIVLSSALKEAQEQGDPHLSSFFRKLSQSPLSEFSNYLTGTKAASLVDKDMEKTTLSIRASLLSKIASLEYLEDASNPFSIKKWIQQEPQDQWLFLMALPEQRESLQPLLTTWMNVAIQALMTLAPDFNRRFWFIMDELPALNKLPSLEKALSELRKYGGCIVSGIQDVPQLKKIYGHPAAQTILNQSNTKLFFRSTDPETCRYISEALGQKEEYRVQENISYGAHTMRDGVSLNQQKMLEYLVLPTEISNLKDLECFIKLPEGCPVTKLQMRFKSLPLINPSFIPKLKERETCHAERKLSRRV